ncbi:hypothetical protein PTSG_06521 [Salpingoeca rosetta]|uniref:Uncharacterized protein n=1 Tax=Salpingoeca rosetta (strain ATCC 50818 / BSB-021) TaxID=946362 RepID=F2UG20_SALR5|nr:uncharacterized protein PTSG_06521 [Salpingoeca rosetta]EGD75448.1 hypothetical protein PTSG_06521 [Salpingoeca rosetta]|eukprot:XP_004991905.1 hypothetical protein PTSG_06521 [Salpingoeca rosetta]
MSVRLLLLLLTLGLVAAPSATMRVMAMAASSESSAGDGDADPRAASPRASAFSSSTAHLGVGATQAPPKRVTNAQRAADAAWRAAPADAPSQYLVDKKPTNDGGLLFVYTNDKDAGAAPEEHPLPPCDVSAVISYRERIDPIHQIIQTRLRQEGVCHFHLVVVLWDVAWTKHQVEEYVRVLKTRPRTTLLIHRGSLTCYMCLRNMALPYIASTKYTLWADHGTLWKDNMLAVMLKTARTDPRKPVLVAPHVNEFESTDGHITVWRNSTMAEEGDSHHPHTYILLYSSAKDRPLSIRQRFGTVAPKGTTVVNGVAATDLAEPHIYLTANQYYFQAPFSGGQGRLMHTLSLPILRKFGRQRQVTQVEAEGAFPLPSSGYEASDVINFMWQWEPMTNIQHTHYTNANNGFVDLNFRCLHSDLTMRLSEMSMLERVPNDPQTHAALIMGQLGLAFWHQFCFVDGADVNVAKHPMQLSQGAFTCNRWLSLPEALGMHPHTRKSRGIVFRSEFSVLHSVPFNLTAADELRGAWDERVRHLSWTSVSRLAEGKVETKCLDRRYAIAIISGLDTNLPGHLRLLRSLQGLSSLVLEEAGEPTGKTKASSTRTQLWLLLKTRPLKKTPVPLRSFAALLDDVVEQVRLHNPQHTGQFLKVQYLSAEGDATEQYVLWTAGLKVRGVRHHRIALQELQGALRPRW